MADIGSFFEMDFHASQIEMAMIKDLIMKMLYVDDEENFDWISTTLNDKGTTMTFRTTDELSFAYNALLGKMSYRETRHGSSMHPDCDLIQAPTLFSILFPTSRFSLETCIITFSGGAGPEAIKATYDGKELTVSKCSQFDEDELLEGKYNGSDEFKQLYDELGRETPFAEYVEEHFGYDRWLDDESCDCLSDIIDELRVKGIIKSEEDFYCILNGATKIVPERDQEYERSFFQEGDLLDWLVKKQIDRNVSLESLSEYLQTLAEDVITEGCKSYLMKKQNCSGLEEYADFIAYDTAMFDEEDEDWDPYGDLEYDEIWDDAYVEWKKANK